MDERMTLEMAMRRAYALGQTYFQQADSESYSQNKKADETTAKFNTLLRETLAAQLAQPAQAVDTGNLVDDPLYKALDALYERGWSDSEKHKHDPRGTNEWQAVQDIFRANRAIGNLRNHFWSTHPYPGPNYEHC